MTSENPVVPSITDRYAGAVIRRAVTVPLTVVGLVLALGLTGCAGILGGPTGQTGGGTGGSFTPEDESPDDVVVETGTDSGPGVPTTGALPATFPRDVPLIDGPVAFGLDLGTGWTVIIRTDDTASAFEDAQARLTAAGFATEAATTTPDGSFGVFSGESYQITISASETADFGLAVTYVVVILG